MLPGHLLTLIIFALTYAVIALGEIPWCGSIAPALRWPAQSR